MLRHIDVTSAFKIGAVTSALTFAIIGLIIFLPMSMLGIGAMSMLGGRNMGGAGMGLVGASFAYMMMIVFYGIMGGIGGAVWAWVYNMVAGWIGGLQFDLD